ncbi:MAG: SatD family protein [Rhodothermaceae bacterium]|nr:SatD family protein [Rhodothermaceae bacterium]
MTHAIVLIGDLIESRKLSDRGRAATQKDLKNVLGQINRDAPGILSPLTITLGDEFQAVYQSAGSLFTHLWTIMAAIHPVYARFSVSAGAITTPINRKQAIGMDGPAFHAARDGVNILKNDEGLLRVNIPNPEIERLMNASLMLVSKEMLSWNSNRFHILQKLGQGEEVSRIAADMGLSEVAVYKNRKAGALDVIHELTSGLAGLIDSEIKKQQL